MKSEYYEYIGLFLLFIIPLFTTSNINPYINIFVATGLVYGITFLILYFNCRQNSNVKAKKVAISSVAPALPVLVYTIGLVVSMFLARSPMLIIFAKILESKIASIIVGFFSCVWFLGVFKTGVACS